MHENTFIMTMKKWHLQGDQRHLCLAEDQRK